MPNQRHALYRLAGLVDWSVFDKEFGSLYCPDNGCPGKPTRLLVGMHYLKHVYGLSDEGVVLRQSYARTGPRALQQANRYGHARQYRRMRRCVKRLRTYLGRVVRDIERKTADNSAQQAVFTEELGLVRRLLTQRKENKNKLYSVHAPEVECISKGKVHKRYEFGVKASIATTSKSNFVVGGMALPGNPYDGHTLKNALTQVRRLTGQPMAEAFVDRGYRGHDETGATRFPVSGFAGRQRLGITPYQ